LLMPLLVHRIVKVNIVSSCWWCYYCFIVLMLILLHRTIGVIRRIPKYPFKPSPCVILPLCCSFTL
jgi:succinate dehydrogenase hydrophobic anchor subunit